MGGKTVIENGQALCANCHSKKTHKDRLKKINNKKSKEDSSWWINPLTGKKEKYNTIRF